jgi:hypothetical protein
VSTRLKVPEPLRRLAAAARADGWLLTVTGGGHLKWMPPQGGAPVFTASTPGDWRSSRNARAKLRRAGLNERTRQ